MSDMSVLIVDDHPDVRRVLRAGLETLSPKIQIADVPSGEEALLVMTNQPVDLMIVDVRLPGISGVELIGRARLRNPRMKFILITGTQEQHLRDAVANTEAEAFFFKPIYMPDFLSAVQRSLGSGNAVLASPNLERLTDRLSRYCEEQGFLAASLLDGGGQVLAQAGDLPESLPQPTLAEALRLAMQVGGVSGWEEKAGLPDRWVFLSMSRYSLLMVPIDESSCLLCVAPFQTGDDTRLEASIAALRRVVGDLQAAWLAVNPPPKRRTAPRKSAATDISLPLVPEGVEQPASFKRVLEQIPQEGSLIGDADAFWDASASSESADLTAEENVNYDPASKPGFAPDERQ
jgi:CheY-like chemotaxis protein